MQDNKDEKSVPMKTRFHLAVVFHLACQIQERSMSHELQNQDSEANPTDSAQANSAKESKEEFLSEFLANQPPREQYDPFFLNERMRQSQHATPFEAQEGSHEVLGNGDRFVSRDGRETYVTETGNAVTTEADGRFTVSGDAISLTSDKAQSKHTIIFADGSRVYLQDGRIRAVSSERNNYSTAYSQFREFSRAEKSSH